MDYACCDLVTRGVEYKILVTHSLALEAAALFPAAGVDESRLPPLLAALPEEEDEIALLRSGDVSTSVSTWSPPFFLRPPPPLPAESIHGFQAAFHTWIPRLDKL